MTHKITHISIVIKGNLQLFILLKDFSYRSDRFTFTEREWIFKNATNISNRCGWSIKEAPMDPEIGKCLSAEDNSLENWSSMPEESSAWKRWCDKHGNLLEVKKMPTSRSQKRDAAAEAGTEKGNAGWKHRFAVEISGRHGLVLSAESRERTLFRRTAISLVGAERRLARNDVVDVVIPQRKFSAGLIESSDSYPSTHPGHGLLLSSPLHLFPLSVTGAASFVTRVLPPNSTVHRYF